MSMSIAEMEASVDAGDRLQRVDRVEPWELAHCARATWYRFMASADAPAGLYRTIGRRRLLCLPVFLEWLGATTKAPTDCGGCSR